MSLSTSSAPTCVCEFCRRQVPFQLPLQLLEAIRRQECVVFAGAGVSTEQEGVYPFSFYNDIAGDLGIENGSGGSFPELMTRFCREPNGRVRLVRKIHDRIRYLRSFPQLYRTATRFHRALASIWQIEQVFTTNWDDFFERECGAIPFVSPEDFAFWSLPGRKVFKVHGSMTNVGSIVATAEDYAACEQRMETGLIGSTLKLMLATKTFLFVGYSLTDSDFLHIHSVLKHDLGAMQPHSYVVTLDRESLDRFAALGLTPIVTDAAYFAETLVKHLTSTSDVVPVELILGLTLVRDIVTQKHVSLVDRTPFHRHPELLHCASYQDGLIHGLERILAHARSGEYSRPGYAVAAMEPYRQIRREKLRKRAYHDVAYVDGYVTAHIMLQLPPAAWPVVPAYYVFGAGKTGQLHTLAEYRRRARRAKALHSAAYRQAVRMLRTRMAGGRGVVPQHTPFLL